MKAMVDATFTEDKIKVMQSFLDTGSVLCRVRYKGAYAENSPWYESQNPTWDWYHNDYKEMSKNG